MSSNLSRWVVAVALWATGSCAFAAAPGETVGPVDLEAELQRGELPRVPPTEPADALRTFQLKPGCRIEQVAAEPLVSSPVAMAFDEDGRLFVAEMRGYPSNSDDRVSRVSMLVDLDGDGRFDRSTVYADGLRWTTAVACWDGGIFVGDAPDLWYFKDTDGDGRTDVRSKVFTGFGDFNPDGLLNSFNWTLDNRIEVAVGSSGGGIMRLDEQGKPSKEARPVSIRGRNVAIEPRSLSFELTSGAGQFGMSFDDWGHKFVCSSSLPTRQAMYEERYLAAAPHVAAPSSLVEISAEPPPYEVFRTSPVEAWRVLRTRMRVAGQAKGPTEGGKPSGYFTSATGVTIYRGTALPPEMYGMAIIGEVSGNLVHRKRLKADGLLFAAERIDPRSEWLTSTDNWFRPAQFANAPDGALYIADMYREFVENPSTIPTEIVRHIDPSSGRDRGRIYRVVGDKFSQPPMPKLRDAPLADLVALLEHPNAWQRQTAARLLYQRQDRAAAPALRALADGSRSPIARMQAMYALDGLHALDESIVLRGLDDDEAGVREHAIRLSERLNDLSPVHRRRLFALADDDALGVRYQLAFTLGLMTPDSQRDATLLKLARRDGNDPWMQFAIGLSMSGTGAAAVLNDLLADEALRRSKAGSALVIGVASSLGQRGAPLPVSIIALPKQDEALVLAGVRGYAEGLARTGRRFSETLDQAEAAALAPWLARVLDTARTTAADDGRTVSARARAVKALPLGNFAEVRGLIQQLLDQRQPQELQIAALGALERFNDPGVAPLLLEVWPTLGPNTRAEAAEALLARPERVTTVLDAIEKGAFQPRELEASRRQLLLHYPDAAIRARATKLLGHEQLGRRRDVVDAYRGALTLTGDVTRGREIFMKNCSACHIADRVGHDIGPNLSAVKNRGAEYVMTNVLDPSREVNPQYVNYVLLTSDGRTITGMIAAETAAGITFRRSEGATEFVPRSVIDELQSTGLSLMPEGLEKQIDQQAMADLVAFVLSIK